MKKLIALIAVIAAILGCESGGPNKQVEDNRMQMAQKLRQYFDQSGGDMNRLTAEQKAELLQFYKGSEADMQRAWGLMQAGGLSGQGPRSSSGMTTGPGMQGGTTGPGNTGQSAPR